MALPLTITGISTAVAPVGPFRAKVRIGNESYDPTLVYGIDGTNVNNNHFVGQTFKTGQAFTLNSVDLMLFKVGAPAGDLTVTLHLTEPKGTQVASIGTVLGADVPTARGGVQTLTLATPYNLAANTVYCIKVTKLGFGDSSNYFAIEFSTQNPVGSGVLRYGDNLNNATSSDSDIYYVLNDGIIEEYDEDKYYFIGMDASQRLQVQKATDPTSSFANIGGTQGGTVQTISACQASNVIHVVLGFVSSGPSISYSYYVFDTATDTWIVTGEVIASSLQTTGQTGALQFGCSLVVRSTGEVVAFFNGAQSNTMGTARARVHYSRRTAPHTWTAPVQVDGNVASDNIQPLAVLGEADTVHFMWVATQNLPAHFNQRTLSAANALQTAVNGGASPYDAYSAISYERAGSTYVVCGGNWNPRFVSALVPTLQFQGASQASPARRLFYDPFDTTVHYIYVHNSTLDINRYYSTNDGANELPDSIGTAIFTGSAGTTNDGLSKNATIYQRGAAVVFPYIVNDNGTLKYNEYTVRALGASGTGALSSNVSAVSGSGAVTSLPVTGTGALLSQASTTNIFGKSESVGTGALTNPDLSIVAGVGVTAWRATGALVADLADLDAVGTALSPPVTGTGALTTGIFDLDAFGNSLSTGTAGGGGDLVITGTSNWFDFGRLSPRQVLSQTFLPIGSSISKVAIKLRKTGAPTDGLVVKLYATDASHVPTTLLGTSDVLPASSLSTTGDDAFTFTFPAPVSVTEGVEHAVTVSRTGALDNANNYNLSFFVSTYAGGELWEYSGVGWYTLFGTDTYSVITHSAPGGLNAPTATLTGSGVSQVVATGALVASAADLDAVGAAVYPPITGTGALVPVPSYAYSDGGLSASVGTGALGASVAVASGSDVAAGPRLVVSWFEVEGVLAYTQIGTGALTASSAAVSGFGVDGSVGISSLTSGASTLAGVGALPQATGTGALLSTAATLTAAGISLSSSTSAALLSQSNFLQLGNGLSSSVGTAALAANVSTIVGVGVGNLATGTGALTSVATLAGAGTSAWRATGALASGVADLDAVGKTAWAASGSMPAQTATVVAPGASSSSGSGVLASSVAVIEALGSAVTGVGGTGALATFATLTAAGVSASSGTAVLIDTAAAIVAPGVSQSRGTGTMPSASSALSALGLGASVGTSSLASQAAALAGSGASRWVGTGALLAGPSTIAATGSTRWVASGALSGGVAAIAGSGASSSRQTSAALQASVAYVSGFEGVVVISGTGSIPSQSAQIAGVGRVIATGTGSLPLPSAILAGAGLSRSQGAAPLLSQASVITSAGLSSVTGTASLVAAASSVSGSGSVAAAISGTGALVAGVADLDGIGLRQWVASGAIAAAAATLAGAGKTGWQGSGALAAQVAAATGAAVARWVATGTLGVGSAAVSGAGLSGSAATAALLAARSTINGYEGVSLISGAGELQAQSGHIDAPGTAEWLGGGALAATGPSLSGVSVSESRGTGVLVVSDRAVMAGAGVSRVEGSGALGSRPATLFGAAVLVSSGAGELVAQDHALTGVGKQIATGWGILRHTTRAEIASAGTSGSVGTGAIIPRRALMLGFATQVAWAQGDLVASSATVVGTEQVVTSGSGEVVAGAAEIVGVGTAGETTWIYPEPTPLPGGYPGTAPYRATGIAAAPTGGAAAPTLPPPPWWLGRAA